MKKIVFTLLMFLCASMSFAQEEDGRRPRFSPDEFRAHMEHYISKEAHLTKEESLQLFPVLHEMKEKQREISREMNDLKFMKPSSSVTDKEYSTRISKIKQLNVKISETEELYYKRMCKVVSPEKVFRLMQAEDRFHRDMLRRFKHPSAEPKNHHRD